jgi:hypothetical protein
VGDVYSTQMSHGLSWYILRSAYCKNKREDQEHFSDQCLHHFESNCVNTCPLCFVREMSKPISTSLSVISFFVSS